MTKAQKTFLASQKTHCHLCGQVLGFHKLERFFYDKKKEPFLFKQHQVKLCLCPTCYAWRVNLTHEEMRSFIRRLLLKSDEVLLRSLGPVFTRRPGKKLKFYYELMATKL